VLHLPGAAIGDPGLAGIEDSDPVGRDRDTVPAAPLSMGSPLVTHCSASGRLLRRASSPFALPAACPELRTRLPMPKARLGRHLFAGFRAAASLSALPRDFVFLVFLTFRPVCSGHRWANSTSSTGEARGWARGSEAQAKTLARSRHLDGSAPCNPKPSPSAASFPPCPCLVTALLRCPACSK
jgi:hypothetical protein